MRQLSLHMLNNQLHFQDFGGIKISFKLYVHLSFINRVRTEIFLQIEHVSVFTDI